MRVSMLFLILSFGLSSLAQDIILLEPKQVYQKIKDEKVYIFDLNPESIYKKNHLPGAVNASYDNLALLLPKEKNAALLFYCMNTMCSASHDAALIAKEKGYRNISRMQQGIQGWLKQKLPTESKKTY